MSNTLKISGRATIFIAVLLFILYFSSFIFVPKNNLEGFGMENVSANGILAERQNSIDVLVLGDSESFSSFSPMEMYDREGFTSYVCGTSNQLLYYTESLFNQALENQKPNVVMIETNMIFRSFLASDFIGEKLSRTLPIFEYHNRWKSLKAADLMGEINYSYVDTLKGFKYNTEIKPADDGDTYMAASDKKEKIPASSKLILNRMIQKCKDNNIEILFVSTPSTKNWNMKRHNAMIQYSIENDVKYIDLNTTNLQDNIDWKADTRDYGDHLNYSGAVKVSKFMAKYLKDNYGLSDHKSDSDYSKWNEMLLEYKELVNK